MDLRGEPDQRIRLPEASDLCRLPAVGLARLIAERSLSVTEVVSAFLDRIEAVNDAVNAIVSLRDREDILAEAQAADAFLARGRGNWSTFRPADRGQGSDADQRPAHDVRLAHLRRFRAGRGQLRRRANAHGRCDHHRQDQRAGIRLRLADLQRGVRHDTQRLRPASDFRRIERRRGRRACAHMLPVADGSDLCGSLRNPAAWSNIFGFRTLARKGAQRAVTRTFSLANGCQGADGAKRRRSCPAARRTGRLRSALAVVA